MLTLSFESHRNRESFQFCTYDIVFFCRYIYPNLSKNSFFFRHEDRGIFQFCTYDVVFLSLCVVYLLDVRKRNEKVTKTYRSIFEFCT